ncbi:hypothetical protein ACFFLZ_10250 [Photobacterium aphoticum]|uniref:Uncharacterized protein n=1 Tax=Photobacterium aphoticum TaxID=754436 RepID=A0A0J1GFB5_9GAMM|nr:hypothetical protein [Photobacterium aphoticum]KLU98402.1 hypothetical protein ABT58_22840 [Photobacterium aphoticum]PSU55379.1 hypothetical protein C9I90_16500 [Photobacterium aphoticum]GHA67482.1 hypothetical protein GCM10007086_46030 [Photobacterium aphoticum]
MKKLSLNGAMLGFIAPQLSEQEVLTRLAYNAALIAEKVEQPVNAARVGQEYYLVNPNDAELEQALSDAEHSVRSYDLYLVRYQHKAANLVPVPTHSSNPWNMTKSLVLDTATKQVVKIRSNKEQECYEFEVVSELARTDFAEVTEEQWTEIQEKFAQNHQINTMDDAVRYGLLKDTGSNDEVEQALNKTEESDSDDFGEYMKETFNEELNMDMNMDTDDDLLALLK